MTATEIGGRTRIGASDWFSAGRRVGYDPSA
jgi:hypothetical protein